MKGIIPSNVILSPDAPIRVKMLYGKLEHKEKGKLTNEYSIRYDRSKYLFMLKAPFEVTKMCCNVMKKTPFKTYENRTNRKAFTGQMASESKLRAQNWVQNGCNGFYMKHPISSPMAFWTDQDVLLYIKSRNLPIASAYGDVVIDYEGMNQCDGQMNLIDYMSATEKELFDLDNPLLKTTLCDRTGCSFCGYGCQMENKENSRFNLLDKLGNKNLRDYVFRGGAFDNDGLWKPNSRGLGYWFVIAWINKFGGFNIFIPEYEKYEKEYGNELTQKYLSGELVWGYENENKS